MSRLFLFALLFIMLTLLGACVSLQADQPKAQTSAPTEITPSVTVPSRSPTPILPPLEEVAVVPELPLATRTPACRDAPTPRLIVGERGQVSDEDDSPLNVRSGPSTEYRILGRLEVYDIFFVLDGPLCGGEYAWYRVERIDGLVSGWIAEGDFNFYFVEPYMPG